MPEPTTAEGSAETGKDDTWFANNKRMHDEFLQESLDGIRKMRTHFDRMLTNAIGEDDARAKVGTTALVQAVNTQGQLSNVGLNLLGLISDRSWNLDEVSKLASADTQQTTALATIVAAKLAESLGPAVATKIAEILGTQKSA